MFEEGAGPYGFPFPEGDEVGEHTGEAATFVISMTVCGCLGDVSGLPALVFGVVGCETAVAVNNAHPL